MARQQIPDDDIDVDLSKWTPGEAVALADTITAKLQRGIEQPGVPVRFTPNECQFIGKAMLVQVAIVQMRDPA